MERKEVRWEGARVKGGGGSLEVSFEEEPLGGFMGAVRFKVVLAMLTGDGLAATWPGCASHIDRGYVAGQLAGASSSCERFESRRGPPTRLGR